jgi:hypothetical protein
MGATITQAGEDLIAQKQGAQQVLNVTRFIFANVPGLDHTAPINRAAPKPPAAQIVHEYTIPAENRGYVNPSQVVYSAQIGSDVGDWDFNWIGLETAEGVLFAVSTVALQQKRRNIPPIQVGNNLTRNFLVVFDGAQALTGITIDASTWQHDFTVRLAGIDERERQSNRDIYGRACFFGSSLQLEKVGATYRLKPGTAYIEGIRLPLAAVQPVAPPAIPTTAWVDVSLQRELSDVVASWNIAWGPGKTDYVDSAGVQHYLVPIAELPSSTVINDLRPVEAINSTLLAFINTKEPAFAAGTTAQYRRGDKTWRDFATDVRAAVLTGLSNAVATAVAATDSVLIAIGKLQAQVTGLANSKLDANANAVSASKLATARTIGGVAFDGTANINLPGVNAAGNQNTTGNAATATKLATARALTIGGTSRAFDGTNPLSWTLSDIGAAAAAHGHAIADVTGLQAAINAASGLCLGVTSRDPNDADTANILSNHANSPDATRYWHIFTSFYSSISATANRAQLAIQYNGGNRAFARSCFSGSWTDWVRLDQDVTKEPVIEAGTTAQYWRGDKTWRDFATDVRASLLTGLSTATNAAIGAADTILTALGKLQAQVTGLATSKLDATANAVSATKLQTARTIGGVVFDGTANINLPGVNAAGNQNTTGNAATATKLQTARTINSVAFDGTANITVEDNTKEPSIAAGTTAQYWRGNKTWRDFATDVRASVLAGLSTASAVAIAATDSVLVAFGKLQAQINGVQASINNLPITASYISTQQAIVLGGTLTLAHGLPRAPQLVDARMVCVIAQYGYAVGDEVAANPGLSSVNASSGWALIPTESDIQVKIGSAATVVIRKDTGNALAITPANWRLVVRAWA